MRQEKREDEWILVWSDEFDGRQRRPHAKWDFDLGNGFFDYRVPRLGGRLGQRGAAVLHARAGEREVRDSCCSSAP
jgi:hypothetical protein